MRVKALTYILIALCVSITGISQSVYHFSYNFHNKDTTSYQAVFIRHESGGGLARIRYELPGSTEAVVVETDVQETAVQDNPDMQNISRISFNCINPRVVKGHTDKMLITTPSFIFTYNPATEFVDPTAVVADKSNTEADPKTTFVSAFMENKSLNRSFLSQFFSKGEPIYENLFGISPRGNDIDRNTRIHLLIVANTLEQTIGASCRKDKERAIETFEGFARFLGIKLSVDTIAGSNYNKKAVEAAIANLKPSSKDIVVFYYSGHGFRKAANDKHKFPFIDLRAKPSDNYLVETLNMEDIFNSIRKKGARFNLVLSDCCNSDVETLVVEAPRPFFMRGSGVEWSQEKTKELFLPKKPVSILATAAESGQRASCNRTFGGFFSYFLKASMEDNCSALKENSSWQNILADTKTLTTNKAKLTYCDKPYIPANICQQFPYYIIK